MAAHAASTKVGDQVEADALSGRCVIRGVFSASQIARQLGVAIPSTEVARTFSEIEAALGH